MKVKHYCKYSEDYVSDYSKKLLTTEKLNWMLSFYEKIKKKIGGLLEKIFRVFL